MYHRAVAAVRGQRDATGSDESHQGNRKSTWRVNNARSRKSFEGAIHTVKMGLGVGLFARLHEGARLSFVRRKINGEIWLPATSIYEGSARLGLIRVVRQRGESEFTNYRKCSVDTQSSFVPRPVKQ